MGLQDIDLRGESSAAPPVVWALLADSSTWPSWTPIEGYEQVRPSGPDGTGEVRTFRTGRHRVREEIIESTPPTRLTYTLLGGLALRDYRAQIDVEPRPAGGSRLRWHTTFRPKVAGSGWLYRRALEQATRAFVDGLIRAAEAKAAIRALEGQHGAGPNTAAT
ncbi:MAG: SRPBCC family protein [bacterium]